MKENEAPKKLYLHIRPNKEIGSTWHGNKISDTDIEYTRTDAFIEKACFYIKNMILDMTYLDTDGNEKYDIDGFIEDFRKYMEE